MERCKIYFSKCNRSKINKHAKNIAFSIANSPLVKTAIAGEDSNFGRIIMAIGKSGEPLISKIQIKFGNYLITEHGKVAKDYNEKDLKEYMKWDSINMEINLNIGNGSYTATPVILLTITYQLMQNIINL